VEVSVVMTCCHWLRFVLGVCGSEDGRRAGGQGESNPWIWN